MDLLRPHATAPATSPGSPPPPVEAVEAAPPPRRRTYPPDPTPESREAPGPCRFCGGMFFWEDLAGRPRCCRCVPLPSLSMARMLWRLSLAPDGRTEAPAWCWQRDEFITEDWPEPRLRQLLAERAARAEQESEGF